MFTRYAFSCMGDIVAFVSQYPKSPKGNVTWYGVLLYTCNEMMSEFVFFKYFMDEIVILKNLCIGLNSKSDLKSCCLF